MPTIQDVHWPFKLFDRECINTIEIVHFQNAAAPAAMGINETPSVVSP